MVALQFHFLCACTCPMRRQSLHQNARGTTTPRPEKKEEKRRGASPPSPIHGCVAVPRALGHSINSSEPTCCSSRSREKAPTLSAENAATRRGRTRGRWRYRRRRTLFAAAVMYMKHPQLSQPELSLTAKHEHPDTLRPEYSRCSRGCSHCLPHCSLASARRFEPL